MLKPDLTSGNAGKMSDDARPGETLADLASRRAALRQAAGVQGADPRSLLDAALTELDGAIDALSGSLPDGGADDTAADGPPGAARAERRLLQARLGLLDDEAGAVITLALTHADSLIVCGGG